MKKLKINKFVLFFCITVLVAELRGVDDSVPNGVPIIIQAEDCTITAISGNFTTGTAPVGWGAATPVVWVSTDGTGDTAYHYGDIKFAFPNSIPDGEYLLSVKWHTGKMNAKPWRYLIDADSGSVTEGSFNSGQWHYFYPGNPNTHDDQWFTDFIAGPNGISFPLYVNSPVRPYLVLSGIGANDFHVRLSDMAFSRDNYIAVDYFILQPVVVQNKTIHAEAEDCIIASGGSGGWLGGGELDTNVYWDTTDTWVRMSTNPSGNTINAKGIVIYHLPSAVPDGEYILKMGYKIGGWGGAASAAFKIAPALASSGSIQEDGIVVQNNWHTFYPNGIAGDYQLDDLAGPAGLSYNIDPATPIATSVTVSNVGAGEFTINVWDQSWGNYDFFSVDFFELIPVE